MSTFLEESACGASRRPSTVGARAPGSTRIDAATGDPPPPAGAGFLPSPRSAVSLDNHIPAQPARSRRSPTQAAHKSRDRRAAVPPKRRAWPETMQGYSILRRHARNGAAVPSRTQTTRSSRTRLLSGATSSVSQAIVDEVAKGKKLETADLKAPPCTFRHDAYLATRCRACSALAHAVLWQ